MNEELLKSLQKITEEEQEFLDGKKEINKGLYTNQTTMVIDSKKLIDSGKLIQVRTHARFVHFPKHTHNYVEVIYMCEGHTTHVINDDTVTLQKGELLFLNQHATQEILPAGKGDIAINFIILPEFFDQSLRMIGEEENQIRDFIVGCLRSEEDTISYLHFKVADILPIQNLVENLVWTIQHNQQNKRSINQITMGLLFLQLMNHTDKVIIGEGHKEQEVLLQVLRFIEEHYREGELSDLAKELHYDLYWLSRLIKKRTGKTYTELVQAKRLSQAAYFLSETGLKVVEISMRVGYDNLSYFHRIFRAKYGVSPRQYRVANMRTSYHES